MNLEEKKPTKNKRLERANILHSIKDVTHNLKEILKKRGRNSNWL